MTVFWAGLAAGAIYTLVAIGYNIPLAQSGFFNFAQGATMVLSCFLAWFLMVDVGLPWWVAAPLGGLICTLVGLAIEAAAVRSVASKHGGHAVLVTTVGTSVLIEGLLLATWAKTPKSVEFFGGTQTLTLLGGRLDVVDLWLVGIAVIASVAMHLVSRFTGWGLAGRAANDDPEAAQAKGINVGRQRAAAFALAGCLAGILGPVLAPKTGVDVSFGMTLTIFGFVALTVGGVGSYLGCLLGGLTVGLAQAVASRYLGVEYAPILLFLLLLVVLLLRPTGLLGRQGLRMV